MQARDAPRSTRPSQSRDRLPRIASYSHRKPPPPSPRTATILSGGKRPSGNSQREIKTSFTLLEAVSTYIHCLISFASQAGGEGGPGSEAALLGKGVQGPGAEQSARSAHPSMVRPARVSSSLDPGGRHHPIE